MSAKTIGIILAVVGVIIVLAMFLAGPLGLGGASFGIKHILGLIVGIVVFLAGAWLAFIRKS